MATHRKHHAIVLLSVLLLLTMLFGCVHQKFVSEPYPRWGEESRVDQSGDNGPLIVRTLFPPEPAKARACVLLVHGMNEHIGRYGEVARYFSRQFIVAGFDFYAHGLSNPLLQRADLALTGGADRQDVGDAYLAQSPLRDLEPMRRTLDQALRKTAALCDEQGDSKRPVFIVAHSLGALVTASYLMSIRNEGDAVRRVQGVIFLAPAFAVSEPPGWRGWLANPLIKLSFHAETHFLHPQNEPLPLLIFNQLLSLVTVPVLDGLFEVFSWPGLRNFLTPGAQAWVVDYLTDSEEEKARLRADDWLIRRALLRFVKGIEAEIVHFRRQMGEFTLPYYLIYSEQDPITASWGGKDFAHDTLTHHADNEVLALPNLRYHQHLFLKEPARTELLRNIEQWIGRRLHALE
ncbi:alpha-beta hydrolase superfamily lysophospholipase [Nitrosomonas sp. Nm84]|uniref:alpha/beta fold hydrolase n=1 Tax=Nitrosomonas sp. Nm84 TaxID=200124 RepID=UPI000D76FCAD|nr:alpha/beta fold hydrolase [Nitrosomonas sp. Nm84]PXW86051.1 alpha-beta hydrolase superfamily lysophospholipase [Nitrosomonas sp. Nm84]